MKYYAALLRMEDPQLSKKLRPDHLKYLEQLEEQGKILARGPFVDGTGGLVIYIAKDFDEAKQLAENDPLIVEKARSLSLHEWKMNTKYLQSNN